MGKSIFSETMIGKISIRQNHDLGNPDWQDSDSQNLDLTKPRLTKLILGNPDSKTLILENHDPTKLRATFAKQDYLVIFGGSQK